MRDRLVKLGLFCCFLLALAGVASLVSGCSSNPYQESNAKLAQLRHDMEEAEKDGIVTPEENKKLSAEWASYDVAQIGDKSSAQGQDTTRELLLSGVTLLLGGAGVVLNNYIRNTTSTVRTAQDLQSDQAKKALNEHLQAIGVLPAGVPASTTLNPAP